jgi:TM2 domain-containing membrane protein YozV
MTANAQWFWAHGSDQYGPMGWSEIREFASTGQLQPNDLVWAHGMRDWAPAGMIAGLIVRPEQSPPAAPSPNGNGVHHGAADYRWPTQVRGWVNALHKAVNEPMKSPANFVPGPTDPAHVNRVLAGVLAVVLGAFGVHKFLLGRTGPGIAVLLVTLCTFGIGALATVPIGIIEGLLYFLRSDAEFHRIYVVGKRPWF